MTTRQYIGPRFVIKIYENSQTAGSAEWEADTSYEPLTMVTYQNSSYLSKKAVPATVGNPASNADYWVVTGAYNGQIASLQSQINDTNSSISALSKFASLNPKQFGATCDKNVDDSTAVQAMFDYALANHIGHANFYDMTEISFKNVQIKSDMVIDFGECKVYGVAKTDNRVYTLFTVNNADIDVVMNGGEFIGKGGNTPTTNANTEANPPLIDVTTAHSLVIKNGYFHNINNTNEGVTNTTPFADRCGGLFRVHDCGYTEINHCVITACYSSELMFIINVNADREDVNCLFKDNYISNTTTSAFNFVGNNIEVCGNTYEYDYNGSVANTFGLNVNIHDEFINGIFNNAYDNCETYLFQGENVVIENVIIKETNYFARLAARNVRVSNIHIKQVGNHITCIGHIEPGFGGASVHPDVSTSELESCTFTIENCDMENLDGSAFFMLCGDNTNLHPLINIVNCITPKITADGTRRTSLVIGKQCNVVLRGCKIYSRLNIEFSSTSTVGCFINSDAVMDSLKISDCEIVDTNAPNPCYVCAGANTTPVFIVGDNGVSANAIGYHADPTATVLTAANNNLT